MSVEELAARIGLSKELLILLLVQAAILALAAAIGVPAEKTGKIP